MADTFINIELRAKADISGFRAIEQASSKAIGSVGAFGAKIGISLLGAQKATSLLTNELRHIVENIDSIPGIPRETVDSINRAKFAMSEARVQVDQWLSKSLTIFSQLGEGLGYFFASFVSSQGAATDAFLAQQKAADAAASASEVAAASAAKTKLELEAQAAAAKKAEESFKSWLTALQSESAANRERSLLGETPTARLARLRSEAEAARLASLTPDAEAAQQARAIRAKLLLEIDKAELETQQQLTALAERYRIADFDKLTTAQKIAAVETTLLENRRAYAIAADTDTFQGIALENQRLDLERQLLDLKKQQSEEAQKATEDALAAKEAQLQRLQAERQIAATRGDKVEINRLLSQERDLIVDIAAAYRAIASSAKDPAARKAALARAAAIEASKPIETKSKAQTTAEAFANRGSPENSYQSITEGARGGFQEFFTEIGTNANLVAQQIKTSLQTAVDGISDGIYGLITRTKTWGQVWLQVGASILQSLIKMGVQIVFNSALGLGAQKTAQVTAATTGPSIAASYAPASAAVNTATYGSSAVAGAIAAAAAIGLIIGLLARGGFAEGGYTGAGAKYQPAGIVHAGEYVFDQASTNRIGLAQLEALRFNTGRLPGYATGGPVGSAPASSLSAPGSSGRTIYIATSVREAMRLALRNGDYDAEIFDASRRTSYRG